MDTMKSIDKITIDDWRSNLPEYDGSDTDNILGKYLDHEIADNIAILSNKNAVSHIHETWVFWQFVQIASGAWDGNPVFAGRLSYAPHVLHIAKILRATDLVEELEAGLSELKKVPQHIVDGHFSSTLETAEKYPEYSDRLGQIVEVGYDKVVAEGNVLGAIDVPITGDSGNDLKDALASYLDEIRKGNIKNPKTLPLSKEIKKIVSEARKSNLKKDSAILKTDKLKEKYLKFGHGAYIVGWALTKGFDEYMVPILDAFSERGIILAEELRPETDIVGLSNAEFKGWYKVSSNFYKTNKGTIVAVIGFRNAYMLVDLDKFIEICRLRRTDSRVARNNTAYPLIEDNVNITVKMDKLWVRFPPWYNPFVKTIKYNQ